jgi:hypothetical protein
MSIQDDIEAIERALEEAPSDGPWRLVRHNAVAADDPYSMHEDWTVEGADGNSVCIEGARGSVACAPLIASCSPDRIRRLLDALKDRNLDALHASSEALQNWNAYKESEAKLSKALELLQDALYGSSDEMRVELEHDIRDFLKENGRG